MDNEKVFSMRFSKVYPLLIQKAERKNRSREEVLEVTVWLTGYSASQLMDMLDSEHLRRTGGANRRPADAGHPLLG